MKRSSTITVGCLAAGLLAIVPIMMFLAIWQFLAPARPPVIQVPFSEFVAEVDADHDREPFVEAAHFRGREITFWLKDPKSGTKAKRATVGPASTDALGKEIATKGVVVSFEAPDEEPAPWPGVVLAGLLLLLLLAAGLVLHARVEISRLTGEVARLETALRERGTSAPAESAF